jgi:hypothetical protein
MKMETVVNLPVRIVRRNDGSYSVFLAQPEISGDLKIDRATQTVTGRIVDHFADSLNKSLEL